MNKSTIYHSTDLHGLANMAMNKSTIYYKNKALKDSGIGIKGVHVITDRSEHSGSSTIIGYGITAFTCRAQAHLMLIPRQLVKHESSSKNLMNKHPLPLF